MTLTQILQKIKTVVYTKSEIDSMGGEFIRHNY